MKHKISVTLNGRRREDEVEARLLLVHYLRDVAGLTGTMLVILSPWLICNWMRVGQPILSFHFAGQYFYTSNGPGIEASFAIGLGNLGKKVSQAIGMNR